MRTPFKLLSFSVSLLAILVFPPARLSLAEPPAAEQPAVSIVEKARALVEKGEAIEAQDVLIEKGLAGELKAVAAQLEAHREAHPEDVQAWILSARVGKLIDLRDVHVSPSASLEETLAAHDAEATKRLAKLHGFLDRALDLEKTNAEAHYWKAHLFGARRTVVRDGFEKAAWDPEAAIREASEAVRLAPDVLAYREAFALDLMFNQQDSAAVEVMRTASGGRHPYYLLLRQLLEIPVPPGAIAVPGLAENFPSFGRILDGPLKDNHILRVRAYIIAASAADIEAFYRAKWSAFRFFKRGSEKIQDGRVESREALLRWAPGGGLEPYKTEREARQAESTDLDHSVMVIVSENRNLSEELQASNRGIGKLPPAARKLFSHLILANYGKPGAPAGP
jgi:hypothetical protein